MATLTRSKQSVLVEQVKPLLNSYEEFTVQEDYPGVAGYLLTLKTNVCIHRKHTKKDLFFPNSFYSSMTSTALPNLAFLRRWLKHSREATLKGLNKGEYWGEELIGGEWQTVKRHYNQWVYYDRKNGVLVGEVKRVVGNVSPPTKEEVS